MKSVEYNFCCGSVKLEYATLTIIQLIMATFQSWFSSTRNDTVRCIVSSLLDDSGSDLQEVLFRSSMYVGNIIISSLIHVFHLVLMLSLGSS